MDQAKSETRDGMRIDWDVPIAMDDGLVLRADLFRPPAEGRYPVILSYGPYAKGLAFHEGYPSAWERMAEKHPDVTAGSSNKYQNWEVVDPEKWVPDGYACVRVDSRGAGRSPGYIDHFSPRETKDFYECIEWAGVQPWSNGKVGLNGISYYGINQWHVASLQPPHLAAMCVWEGAADWYRDMTHHGGILSTFWANWYDMQVRTVQHGLGEHGPKSRVTGELVCGPETLSEAELARNRCVFGDEILARPLDDDYHKARSPVWSKITAPLLTAANWGGQGLHPRGNFEGFGRAASPQKWLEAHGIEHWTEFYTDYGVQLQKRFFGQGRGHRLGQAATRAAPGAPCRQVRPTARGRMAAGTHGMDPLLSRTPRAQPRPRAAQIGAEPRLRGARRRCHLLLAAARARDRDHRSVGGEALRLVFDRGCRYLRGAAHLRA